MCLLKVLLGGYKVFACGVVIVIKYACTMCFIGRVRNTECRLLVG